jgi:hypothetical protein
LRYPWRNCLAPNQQKELTHVARVVGYSEACRKLAQKSCSEQKAAFVLEDVVSATIANADQPSWPWPDSLDALVAAPDHHKLLVENEQVRVLEVRIPPGQFVPVHTHRWPSVIFTLSAADFIRRDAEGKLLLDTRVTPFSSARAAAEWLPPLPPHSVENVGENEIRLFSVELKPAKQHVAAELQRGEPLTSPSSGVA